jgi:hypothetical protein
VKERKAAEEPTIAIRKRSHGGKPFVEGSGEGDG